MQGKRSSWLLELGKKKTGGKKQRNVVRKESKLEVRAADWTWTTVSAHLGDGSCYIID